MSGRIGCCTFTTECNQQINAIARIEREDRSAILGTVLDECGRPVMDAVVILLKITPNCPVPEPITHTFTDRFGQFCFGPLCPDTTYMLKIFKDDVNVENLSLVCNCQVGSCLGANDSNNSDNCNTCNNSCNTCGSNSRGNYSGIRQGYRRK